LAEGAARPVEEFAERFWDRRLRLDERLDKRPRPQPGERRLRGAVGDGEARGTVGRGGGAGCGVFVLLRRVAGLRGGERAGVESLRRGLGRVPISRKRMSATGSALKMDPRVSRPTG